MGKATELDDFLDRQPPITQEELERRKLRLRPDVMKAALIPDQPVQEALNRVSEGARAVALHDPSSGTTAITVPLDQYLKLVNSYLKDEGSDTEILALTSKASAELGVEQGDPHMQTAWLRLGDQH